MKIGILSDIHGDLSAFRSALLLFEKHQVARILCAGDVVEKGPEEEDVVALLRERSIPCVQGNHDENAVRHHTLTVSRDDTDESLLSPETINFLRQLPSSLELDFDEQRIAVAHATFSDNAGRVFHKDGTHRLSKPFKKDLA